MRDMTCVALLVPLIRPLDKIRDYITVLLITKVAIFHNHFHGLGICECLLNREVCDYLLQPANCFKSILLNHYIALMLLLLPLPKSDSETGQPISEWGH